MQEIWQHFYSFDQDPLNQQMKALGMTGRANTSVNSFLRGGEFGLRVGTQYGPEQWQEYFLSPTFFLKFMKYLKISRHSPRHFSLVSKYQILTWSSKSGQSKPVQASRTIYLTFPDVKDRPLREGKQGTEWMTHRGFSRRLSGCNYNKQIQPLEALRKSGE